MFSPLIDELIAALKYLPGVGSKSATRMALHLLQKNTPAALRLSDALKKAAEEVKRCSVCQTLTEQNVCDLCRNTKRHAHQICVVETPGDILALEQAGTYMGRYFVLYGHLSPIDGIGPVELGVPTLLKQFDTGIEELIIATNPTMEGEATAHYIAEKARVQGIKVTRIAHGVPIGGELEFIDGGTLAHALASRREMD